MNEEFEDGTGRKRIVASAVILAVVAATTLWYLLAGRPDLRGPATPTPSAGVNGIAAPGEDGNGAIAVPGGDQDGVIPVPGAEEDGVAFVPVPVPGDEGVVAGGQDESVHVSPTSEAGAESYVIPSLFALTATSVWFGYRNLRRI